MADLYLNQTRPVFSSQGIESGALVYFYITGTTDLTPVYADAGLTTQLTNPVVANAAGVFPDIYLDTNNVTYRAYLTDADGALLSDVDPYYPGDLNDQIAASVTAAANSAATANTKAEEAAASANDAAAIGSNLGNASRFSYSTFMYGQSLAKARAPLVTTSVSPKLVMFNGGEEYDAFTTYTGNDANWQNVGANMASLVSFSASNPENGEGWGQGLSYVLGQNELCQQIGFYCAADGSRDARELIYYHSGSGRYSNLQSGIQRMPELLGGHVKPIVIWAQGEADADLLAPGGGSAEARVTQAEYYQILQDFRAKVRFDLGPALGRSVASMPVYVKPINSQVYGDGSVAIQASYLDAIGDGGFVVLPPEYQFWQNWEPDGIHLAGQGRRYYAELVGHVVARIESGLSYQAMHVTSAAIVGGTIELTFATPNGSSVVIDTSTFADPALQANSLYGLRFYDASGATYGAINSITASGRKLVVTPSVAPAIGDRIEIAQQPWPGGDVPPTGSHANTNTPRSNIRCGLSHTAEDGTQIYHYTLPQRITV